MLVVSTLIPCLQVPNKFNFKDLFSGIVQGDSLAPNEYFFAMYLNLVIWVLRQIECMPLNCKVLHLIILT
jgi:hypothetical protein